MAEILILGGAGWHGRELARAFAELGWTGRSVGFTRQGFATGSTTGLRVGSRRPLPAAVLVRSIPAGSFEQVTLRLSLLHALAMTGVQVVNEARAIERCVDKAMTNFLLRRAGLPTPKSWTTEDRAQAHAIASRETLRQRRLVLKPLFGSQGRGLRLIAGPDDLPPPEAVAGVYHLQRFVDRDGDWQDSRVLVVAGAAIAAMRRSAAGWITNIARGGKGVSEPAGGELGRLALAAAGAVGAVLAGVDIIHDAAGRPFVLEVNSMPAWQGLQAVTPFPIAPRIAAAVLAALPRVGLAA